MMIKRFLPNGISIRTSAALPSSRWITAIRGALFMAALILAVHSQCAKLPEKLRVMACDLESIAIQTPGAPDNERLQELQQLLAKADPDIIFLQGASDWQSCERICKFRPGLRVITCSAFSQTGSGLTPQVAILARDKAIISWVEQIPDSHAFAFALIEAGSRKLGIFSVQSPPSAPTGSAAAADRLLAEVKRLQQFPKNRPDAYLIAGAGHLKTSLREAGFETVLADPPAKAEPIDSEYWASNAGFLSRPRAIALKNIRKPVIICDIDAANSYSSKFALQTPLLFPGESPAPVQAVVQPPPLFDRVWPIALTVGVCFIGALFLFHRRARPAGLELMTLPAAGGELVPIPPVEDSLRSNLLAWFKMQFMQRLLSQRQQMISTEAEATRRTLVIEEKISQLQTALQDRISAYEMRIQRLETELSAATFENRALIRSQIDLLKEKVAKAKEEFSFRRN